MGKITKMGLRALVPAAIAACVCFGGQAAKADGIENGSFELPSLHGGSFSTSPGATLNNWDILGVNGNVDPLVTSVDHVGSYWTAEQGVQSLDMNGLSYGVIGQTVTGLTAGHEYFLNFWIAGNPDGGPDVKWLEADAFDPIGSATSLPFAPTNNTAADNATFATFTTPADTVDIARSLYSFDSSASTHSNMGWTLQSLAFQASSSSTYIQFTSRTLTPEGNYTTSPYGPALDNVSLFDATAGQPVGAVPLPESAKVGFAMLAGIGGMVSLRKRLRRPSEIA